MSLGWGSCDDKRVARQGFLFTRRRGSYRFVCNVNNIEDVVGKGMRLVDTLRILLCDSQLNRITITQAAIGRV